MHEPHPEDRPAAGDPAHTVGYIPDQADTESQDSGAAAAAAVVPFTLGRYRVTVAVLPQGRRGGQGGLGLRGLHNRHLLRSRLICRPKPSSPGLPGLNSRPRRADLQGAARAFPVHPRGQSNRSGTQDIIIPRGRCFRTNFSSAPANF